MFEVADTVPLVAKAQDVCEPQHVGGLLLQLPGGGIVDFCGGDAVATDRLGDVTTGVHGKDGVVSLSRGEVDVLGVADLGHVTIRVVAVLVGTAFPGAIDTASKIWKGRSYWS